MTRICKWLGLDPRPVKSQLFRILRLALISGAAAAYPIVSKWHSVPTVATLQGVAVVVGEATFRAIWPEVRKDGEADASPIAVKLAEAAVDPSPIKAPAPAPATVTVPPAVF